LPFPILFFIGLTLLLEVRFARHHSNLSFRLSIAEACRRAIACAEAIRSVTHLVLARVNLRAKPARELRVKITHL